MPAHRDILIAVAEYLLEHETMDGEDFNYFCEHGELPPPKPDPLQADNTIEPPARKITMFTDDSSGGENRLPAPGSDPVPPTAEPQEEPKQDNETQQ